jgi:succinate-semialdehyde dehydrogenase/glutarate-semialdehyde dehydrogenase
VCANRIYVQDSVYDAFAAKLAEKVRALKVAKGTDAGAVLGPLIDDNAVAKVEEHVADALAKGAKIALGGKRHALGGRFYEPTILTGVTKEMKVANEETSRSGSSASGRGRRDRAGERHRLRARVVFYARDMGRVWRVAEALEAGIVGVNTGLISTEVAPFGGVKQSGLGREGSKYGIDDFLQIKYISMGGL